jgi:hypothetical protein
LIIGNDYGNEIFIGRLDAFTGLVLLGKGDGTFESKRSFESGFVVPGDGKSMGLIHSALGYSIYLSSQNRGKLLAHRDLRKTEPRVFEVKADVHTLILTHTNGKVERLEVYNRTSFYSNGGKKVSVLPTVKSIHSLNFQGKKEVIF